MDIVMNLKISICNNNLINLTIMLPTFKNNCHRSERITYVTIPESIIATVQNNLKQLNIT